MLNRCVLLVCCLALLALGARADENPAAAVGYAMTPERFAASGAARVGLLGVAIGGWALARSGGTGNTVRGSIVALVAGLIGMVLGGLVVATADGGLGTGNGLGGGVVALVLGVISMILGGLARARSRRLLSFWEERK